MEYKEFFDQALSTAEERYPCTDISTAPEKIKTRAGRTHNIGTKDTFGRESFSSYEAKPRHNIMGVVGYTAGAAAAIVGLVFGMRFIMREGGLKEGGPDITSSGTAAVTDTSEPIITTLTNDTAGDTLTTEPPVTARTDDFSTDDTVSETTTDEPDVEPIARNSDITDHDPVSEISGITVSDPVTEPDDTPWHQEKAPLQWANPASGMGTDWDTEPTVNRFYLIPLELMVKVDGVLEYVEDCGGYVINSRYKDYTSAVYAEPEDRTGVDIGINVYTFIKFFSIPDDDVRDALADRNTLQGKYTSEEVEILLSDDKAAIASAFASRWAIVKGEKLYSPYWLQTHTYDEWYTAGITADDISGRFDELTAVPEFLVEEDFIPIYKAKLSNYIIYCEKIVSGELSAHPVTQPVHPAFEAEFEIIREHGIDVVNYPEEKSTVYGYCTADGTGYEDLTYGIRCKRFFIELPELPEGYDVNELTEAITPYCTEDGKLLPELLAMLPETSLYNIHTGQNLYNAENGYHNYLIGGKWLVQYYDKMKTVQIYAVSEHKTIFRHLIELLWKGYAGFRNISAVTVDDFTGGTHECYLHITGDSKAMASAEKYLSDNGADISLCRFSTPEEMRKSWLPVTRLEYEDGNIYTREPYSNEIYKWFTADDDGDSYHYYGVYTNRMREYDTLEEVCEKLTSLGVGENAINLVKAGSFGSLLEVEPIYADIFDKIRLPQDNSDKNMTYYGVGNSIIVSVDKTPPGEKYMVWEPEKGIGLTGIADSIRFLRDNAVINDDINNIHLVIQKIELVYDRESGRRNSNYVRIVAEKKYHEDILRFISENYNDEPESEFELADAAVDISGLESRGMIKCPFSDNAH